MDDEVDQELLRLAGQVRELGERLDGYDEPIAEINRMVRELLDDANLRPKNFHWGDLEPDVAAERWTNLLEWMQNVLCARYPQAVRALRACWWQHLDAVDSVTAAWFTWLAAYRSGQAAATAVGDWHRFYLPALIEQLDASMASCQPGRHYQDAAPVQVLATAPTTI